MAAIILSSVSNGRLAISDDYCSIEIENYSDDSFSEVFLFLSIPIELSRCTRSI